ncbi:MAG: hypothetical protein Q8O06_00430 [Acetobacterium sp.]|nr:hypothetical protein [Acetobacterium sp.]
MTDKIISLTAEFRQRLMSLLSVDEMDSKYISRWFVTTINTDFNLFMEG